VGREGARRNPRWRALTSSFFALPVTKVILTGSLDILAAAAAAAAERAAARCIDGESKIAQKGKESRK
jgi:hypothetical protein